jgi:hypothetical protein
MVRLRVFVQPRLGHSATYDSLLADAACAQLALERKTETK